MYRHIIKFKNELSEEQLSKLFNKANESFDNRGGKIVGIKKERTIIFEANEDKYGCLILGSLALDEAPDFAVFVDTWFYEDDEAPDENCDVLESYAMVVN